MTEKLTKQSFSSDLSLLFAFLLPLVGFYLFALIVNSSYFVYISFALLCCIFYLIPLRSRLSRRRSEKNLKIEEFQGQSNLAEATIKSQEKAIKSFQEKIVSFSQLKGLTERLSLCLSLEDTSKTLSSQVNSFFGGDDVTIILYVFHSKTGELGISSSQKGQMTINIKSKKGDEFDQWIIKNMQPLLIKDTKSDYRFDIDSIKVKDERSVRSLISVPLRVRNKTHGILRVDIPKENYFTTEDLRFLTTIGDVGAMAIENAQLYERLEQLAIRDGLTGLYLKRHLFDRMPEEISRHLRRKQTLSFIMFDLDYFKKYNDKFGHTAGDVVLRTVSQEMSAFFDTPGNLIFRYGGEEFAVLLPHCSKKKALALADQLRQKIEMQSILLRREKTKITMSAGVASFPQDAKTKDDLIQKADMALYKAKKQGRNQVLPA